MEGEVFKFTAQDDELMSSLEKIEKQLTETGKSADAMGETLEKSFVQSADAAEQFSKQLDENAKATATQAKSLGDSQKNLTSWRASLKESISGIQVFGKSLGEWRAQLLAANKAQDAGAVSTGRLAGAWKLFNNVLKVSIIGAIIAGIIALISYLSKLQPVVDFVSRIMASFNAVLAEAGRRIATVGEIAGKLLKGEFRAAFQQSAEVTLGFAGALKTAAVEAYNLEQRLQALRDAQIAISVQNAADLKRLEQLQRIGQDETLATGDRIKALKELQGVNDDYTKRNLELAAQRIVAAQDEIRLYGDNADRQKALADAQVAFLELQADRTDRQMQAEQEIRQIRKQASAERQKQLDEESKALEKMLKDLETLRAAVQPEGIERDLAEVEKKYNALQRVAADGIAALRKIEERRNLTPEELAQLEELGKIQVALEEQRLSALVDVAASYAEKDIEIEEQLRKSKEALRQKDYDLAVKGLENAKALREQELAITEQQFANFVKVLEENGISQEDIAKRRDELAKTIQKARLESELQFQIGLLEIAKAGDTQAVSQIENTIKLIQEKLNGLSIEGDGQKKTLLERLGFDEKGIEGLKEAGKQVVASLSQIADARVKAAEQTTRLREKDLQEAQEFLIRQQELAAEGLANDSDLAKQEVAKQKELRDAALKEEAKARRAQILLDSAGQISALLTASANIFKALSPIQFAGIPLAIATIGVMFAAFAKAKADALKAAAIPKFRKGTRLEGRSHEEGGLAISDQHGNIVGEAEGDEWLIGTRPSREHDKFLERLNKGEFQGVNLNSLFRPSASNPITEAAPRIERIEREFREVRETQHTAALATAYRDAAREIVQAIEEKEVVMPLKDYKIMKKRGRNTFTTIVREEK